jgi:hypothetical protein
MINPRSKGKRGEYMVRDLIRGFGYEARRTPLSGGIPGWKGDITSRDFPFFVEVKNTAKTTFPQWWTKANDQSQTKPPMIAWIYKGEPFAFVLLSDLIQVIQDGAAPKVKYAKPAKKQHFTDESANQLKFSKQAQVAKKKPA